MDVALEYVTPTYSISRFTDQIYKVVHYKRSESSLFIGPRDPDKFKKNDEKIDSAYSRARRVVLEYALCNPWDYFVTLTIDNSKLDRTDLSKFNKLLSQWLRDLRKKYKSDIKFVLIPELHDKHNAWHMHGFLYGIPEDRLSFFIPGVHPWSLCNRGFKNWDDYSSKFGYCSLSPIKDPLAAAFYIVKYISKDLAARKSDLGGHLYFASHGLNRAHKVAEVLGNCSALNSLLTEHYQFCDVGLSKPSDGLDWTFPLVYDNMSVYLEAWDTPQPETRETRKFDRMAEFVEQLAMEGFV